MAHTTIPLDPKVRDELRTFGHAGETYNDILRRLMAESRLRSYVGEMRRLHRETPRDQWVDLDDL